MIGSSRLGSLNGGTHKWASVSFSVYCQSHASTKMPGLKIMNMAMCFDWKSPLKLLVDMNPHRIPMPTEGSLLKFFTQMGLWSVDAWLGTVSQRRH